MAETTVIANPAAASRDSPDRKPLLPTVDPSTGLPGTHL